MSVYSRREADSLSLHRLIALWSHGLVVVVLALSRQIGGLLLPLLLLLLNGVVWALIRGRHSDGLRRRVGIGRIVRHVGREKLSEVRGAQQRLSSMEQSPWLGQQPSKEG